MVDGAAVGPGPHDEARGPASSSHSLGKRGSLLLPAEAAGPWRARLRVSHHSFVVVGGLTGPSGRQTDRHHVQRRGGGGRGEMGVGRSKGPETGRERAERADGGRHPSSRDVPGRRTRTRQPGWPAVDYKRQRDGETRRPKETDTERELPSGLFPSQQPGVLQSLGAPGSREAKCTPSPSQSACWSARCPLPAARHRASQGTPLPRAASLLPLPHFLLLSLCQTHLELFKPKYSAPSPSSQIPPQFKTSPALAPEAGREGHWGGAGGGGW